MAGGDLEIRHSTVQTQTTTNGTAGNIEIHANNLVFNIDKPNQSLNDLFGISSFTTGSGDAGNLQLQTNSFDMVGGFLATFTGGSGNAGNIELTVTKDISIFGGRGGGNIVTNAVPLGPGPPPSGNAGNLSIHATNLTMAGDSQIQAVTAVGPGKGGNIQVILTGGLELQEASQVGTFSAGGSVGDAGDILISADNVSLIGVENPTPDGNFFGNQTLITASTTGAGKGGTINIEAGNVVITNKAAINTSTSGTGDGGNINVSAKNFNLTNGGHVRAVSTSTSQDSGDAGNFVINAAETILLDKATMTAESAQSSGGNIKLTANDMIQLVDSTIASSVQGDATTVGGDVNLDPDFIILQNSQILAKAVAGKGGNIDLVASKAVLLDAQSNLDASSQTGISGSVTIESPIQVLSGTIAPLPDQPVNVATLYAARCVAGEGGHFSTFVDSKSDSVAPTPGTFLASPFIPVTDASQHGMGNKPALATEVSLSGHEAAMHLAAYTPPVLFAQATGPPVPCP
ncbi:MAG: hypothetical protein KIT39_14185 [Nitrospirales bacterium]|nr:hypothetical protein [Nitrospirales bacterium]